MTRADRIRAMTDEEMARIIEGGQGWEMFCRNSKECQDALNQDKEIPAEMCVACALRWLQEELV